MGCPGSGGFIRGSDFEEGAMIEERSKPCGHSMHFLEHSSLTAFQVWSHPLALQLKMICCMDLIELQFWHIPQSS